MGGWSDAALVFGWHVSKKAWKKFAHKQKLDACENELPAEFKDLYVTSEYVIGGQLAANWLSIIASDASIVDLDKARNNVDLMKRARQLATELGVSEDEEPELYAIPQANE